LAHEIKEIGKGEWLTEKKGRFAMGLGGLNMC
jgi:hypothetical protein